MSSAGERPNKVMVEKRFSKWEVRHEVDKGSVRGEVQPSPEGGQRGSGYFLHSRNEDLLAMPVRMLQRREEKCRGNQEGPETYRESLCPLGMVALTFNPILGRQKQEASVSSRPAKAKQKNPILDKPAPSQKPRPPIYPLTVSQCIQRNAIIYTPFSPLPVQRPHDGCGAIFLSMGGLPGNNP